MSRRARARLFFIGCATLLIACLLPAVSAAGRQLNGFELVQAALRARASTEPLRAVMLIAAVSANLIVPICGIFALTGRARRWLAWLCGITLFPALVLVVQALLSAVLTLHAGVAVWFGAMCLLCAAATWR